MTNSIRQLHASKLELELQTFVPPFIFRTWVEYFGNPTTTFPIILLYTKTNTNPSPFPIHPAASGESGTGAGGTGVYTLDSQQENQQKEIQQQGKGEGKETDQQNSKSDSPGTPSTRRKLTGTPRAENAPKHPDPKLNLHRPQQQPHRPPTASSLAYYLPLPPPRPQLSLQLHLHLALFRPPISHHVFPR